MNHVPGHLWVLFAFLALSFIQWMARKAREQQIINQRKREAARRQEEMLRTGRVSETSASAAPRTLSQGAPPPPLRGANPPAGTREQQLRELRRQALEAQRRKAQASQSSRAGAPKPRVETRPPATSRPSPRPIEPSRKPQAPPASRPIPARHGRTTPSGLERPAPEPLANTKPRLDPSLVHTTDPAHTPDAASHALSAHETTLADIRRAIVLSEVLAPPVALRPAGTPTGLP